MVCRDEVLRDGFDDVVSVLPVRCLLLERLHLQVQSELSASYVVLSYDGLTDQPLKHCRLGREW
jgi:hypothetical protein